VDEKEADKVGNAVGTMIWSRHELRKEIYFMVSRRFGGMEKRTFDAIKTKLYEACRMTAFETLQLQPGPS
jgi:hypothetical protein